MKIISIVFIALIFFSCNKLSNKPTVDNSTINSSNTNGPTLETGKDDKNPNFQIIEIVINSPYNQNGYGLNEFINTDKYGNQQSKNLIIYKFSKETVKELKKFTDIYAFNSSEYGSEVINKMIAFNKTFSRDNFSIEQLINMKPKICDLTKLIK